MSAQAESLERPGERLGQGQEAEVFAWGDDAVVKLYREGSPPGSAEWELDNLRLAAAAGVRVPDPRGTVSVDGRAGVIMERVRGPDLLTYLGRHPWTLDRGARQLAAMQVQLHSATAPPELPSAKATIEEFLARDPRAIEALPDAIRDRGRALLASLPEGHTLCHGDYHPGNLFVHDGEVVVIDWPMMCRSTPEADVARSMILIEAGDIPAEGFTRLLIAAMRRLYLRRYLHWYRKYRSLDMRQVRAWRIVHALERYGTQPTQREALSPIIRRAFGIDLAGR